MGACFLLDSAGKIVFNGAKWIKVEPRGQPMFRGSSFHTIDAKGRIIIPARFRELIRNGDKPGVMLTKLDNGLVAYPFEQWTEIEEKILSLAEKNDTMRRFRRVFIGGAFECLCDSQERILVPPTLREYAGFEKEIVLVGVLDHFEIWSKENWEQENAKLELDMQQEGVRNEIAKLGL
jgi:MraZ protein